MSVVAEAPAPVEARGPRLANWNWTSILCGVSLVVTAVALGASAVLGEPQAIVTAALGLALALAVVLGCFRGGERQFLLTLFLAAFGARIAAAVVSHFVLVHVGRGGFLLLDDRAYDKLGWTLARFWMGIFPGIRDTDQYLMVNYTYLVGAVYYLLGHSLLTVKMLNVAFGGLTAVVVYALGAEIFNQRAARIAALLTAFFPSLMVWSVINLKDILAVLVTTTVVFGLLRYARRHNWWSLGLALGMLFYLENLRAQFFFMLTWLMPAAFLFADRSGWRRKLLFAVPLIAGILALNVYTHNRAGLNWLTPRALTEAEWARWASAQAAQTGIDEMSIKPPKEMETIVRRTLDYLPKGVYYVVLGPTPWEARSDLAKAVIPEMLAWYALLAAACVGLMASFRRSWRDLILPIALTGATVMALAIYEGNTGNIFRHRSMFMPFVFILSGVGLQWLWEWRQATRRVGSSRQAALARAAPTQGSA
jgi:hypothetical protein